MKSIELQTTQNVTINYELAHLRDRIIAFLLDLIFVWVIVFLLVVVLMRWVMELGLETLFSFLIISPIITFYTLAFEALNNGRTPGKMLLRIQVVRIDGKPMRFNDYLLRWIFRLVDIWLSFGSIAVISVTSNKRSQRVGGLLSNSTVVKTNPGYQLTLADILKINTTSDRTPLYPEVRHFREEDMLVVKQTIERYQRFRNSAHREALELLAEKMCKLLKLEEKPENSLEFLRELIRDYIVLTR